MKKEEIIQLINDLIDKRGFSTSIKQNEKFTSSSYLLGTNLKFEISNNESSDKANKYCFKVDSIDDIGEIWMETTKKNNVNIENILKDAISKFNIDLDKELYLIVIIQ